MPAPQASACLCVRHFLVVISGTLDPLRSKWIPVIFVPMSLCLGQQLQIDVGIGEMPGAGQRPLGRLSEQVLMACQPPSCPECAHGWMIALSSNCRIFPYPRCLSYKNLSRRAGNRLILQALWSLLLCVSHLQVWYSQKLRSPHSGASQKLVGGGQWDGGRLVRRQAQFQSGRRNKFRCSTHRNVTTDGEKWARW